MATRKLVVRYRLPHSRTSLVREWGITNNSYLSDSEIRLILGGVHEIDPQKIVLLEVAHYWPIETTREI